MAEFKFSGGNVAESYDAGLVPVMFKPWAQKLRDDHGPWSGKRVLDLATGTGVVADEISKTIGDGSISGADISPEMLEIARKRVPHGEFKECSSELLKFDDSSFDVIVCQQGFQFFPDKLAAAKEACRVLSPGGRLIATTWTPADKNPFFRGVCDVLNSLDLPELAQKMRMPFENLNMDEMKKALNEAGFTEVEVSEQRKELKVEDNEADAVKLAYATPIAPLLSQLPEEKQQEFKNKLIEHVRNMGLKKDSLGDLVSDQVVARK